MANPTGGRDEAARRADLEWLYGDKPIPVFGDAATPKPARTASQARASTPKVADDDGVERAQILRSGKPHSAKQGQTQGWEPQRPAQPARPATQREPVTARPTPKPTKSRIPAQAGRGRGAADSPDGTGAASASLRRRRRRHPIRWALTVLLALILAWLVFLVFVPAHTIATMTKVDAAPAGARPPEQPGTAILLVGTDSREFLSESERQRLGTGDAAGQRADTIMLLYKPPTGRSVLISLPRDSYVTIPGYGRDKLNAAYAYGGPKLLIQTIEQTTDVRIDGYLEIGFGGFASLVDAAGGVEVCLKEPMKDELAHVDLPAGCQTINGTQALGYVRMRYHDPRGDIGRIERQREIVGKLAHKLASPASVLNPIRYWKLNKAVGQILTKSADTSTGELVRGGQAALNVATGDGLSLVVPISNAAGVSDTGASVVIWDRDQALQMFGEIARGDTSRMDRFKTK